MKLYIFPDPLDSFCTLISDDGYSLAGKPDVHNSGRLAQSFDLPEDAKDGHGARLTISYPKKVALIQRGILFTSLSLVLPDAMFTADDFMLTDEKVCPPPVPVPVPPNPIPVPPDAHDPISIINHVYASGNYDLRTLEGCGQFTEACCEDLHIIHSNKWGHIKKVSPQTQYNGHAVDAVQLLVDVGETKAGIYDIIFSKASLNAKPAFNRQGDPNLALYYYPA